MATMSTLAGGLLRGRKAVRHTMPLALVLGMAFAVSNAGAQTASSDDQGSSTDPTLFARYWAQAQEEAMRMQGYASGSFLGIGVADVTQEMTELLKMGTPRGVVVTSVMQGSPAEKAGIRIKDVLVSYNGAALEGGKQLTRMVGETPAGREVRIEILRDGQPLELNLTTAARRVSAASFAVPAVQPAGSRVVLAVPPDVAKVVSVYHSAALGIETEALSEQLASYFGVKAGALVREVTEGSPAEKAGVRAGDIIIYLGERSVSKPADLSRILRERENPTAPLKLGLVRHQQEITMQIEPLDTASQTPRFGGAKAYPGAPKGIPISSTKR